MRAALAALLLLAALPAEAADLTVTVEGVRSDKGAIYVAVFVNPHPFPDGSRAEFKGREAASQGSVTMVFHDLKPGRYAAATFHDENGNGKFDKNMIGAPVEGFALSNNVRPRLGAPSFAECAFELPAGGLTLNLKLIY